MGKKRREKNDADKARRAEASEKERAADEAAARRQRILRWYVVLTPLVAIGLAVGAYYAFDDRRIAALLGLVGFASWLPGLLGVLGGSIRPRDRTRAGSIDFGQRR